MTTDTDPAPALDVAELRRVAEAALPRVYLDCDGVLADFDAAFTERFGHAPHAYEERHGSKTFWRDIRHEAPTFYRDLPLMPGARELVEAVQFLRPIVLTGCPVGGWAEAQKIEWVAEHFPGVPVVTCMARNKAMFCRPGDILVDDRPKYADRWRQAGGVFILHDCADDSIQAVYAALSVSPALALLDELEWARAVVEAAKEFRAYGTVLTACNRGACQRVIEHEDNSDPQAKMYAALKEYERKDPPK